MGTPRKQTVNPTQKTVELSRTVMNVQPAKERLKKKKKEIVGSLK